MRSYQPLEVGMSTFLVLIFIKGKMCDIKKSNYEEKSRNMGTESTKKASISPMKEPVDISQLKKYLATACRLVE
ncbi:hypothetical protein TNCT_674311 [Trichonephila clavata]|uniref:Uncharacterized protein n=1 Tax=Trichonephila clavata TaxID=2740835 RepID=A0A8X6G4A3_TRICU|nr:hypothetical protein TNCT_674311 [Trichonephila clavata]